MATTALPSPRIRRTAQNTQYSYNLDRRIYDAKTYPIQSPQGATVLIYGHENGLTLLWRGGKRLKPPAASPSADKRNGSSTDEAVMVLDSDEASQKDMRASFVDHPEFEDADSDDAFSALPEIVQTLDLSFETAILHVAVLPLAPSTAEDAGWVTAEVLKSRMVFAVACATGDVFVVTLPLTPPSHQSKTRPELRKSLLAGTAGKGAWGETLTLLAGQSKYSDGLAMTLVKQKQSSSSAAAAAAADRSRSGDRSSGGRRPPPPTTRVVVASHTREASGTLRLWDVTVDSPSTSADRVEPFQTEYLPTSLQSIAFNPLHTTQLLAVASPHAVRIYDYSIPSTPEDISEDPFPSQGSWLLSLYPPFCGQGPSMSVSRKPIVAATWIAHGRAVLALLADGQWGIWDIEGTGPTTAGGAPNGGLFGRHASGLRGSGLTSFSVSGYLEGTSPLRNPAAQKSSQSNTTTPGSGGVGGGGGGGEFVPMTPHTRRDALITASAVGGIEKLAAVRGGIDVVYAQPVRTTTSSSGASASPADESAVLWMGGADPIVAVIPGVSRFWDAQLRRGVGGGVNLFSGAQPTRMIRLTDLGAGLAGERCTGATAISRSSRRRRDGGANPPPSGVVSGDVSLAVDDGERNAAAEGLPIDVLVRGESRVVVVRESDDGTPITSRVLVPRTKSSSRAPGTRSASAILTFPRQEKPSSMAFNLSVQRGGGAFNNLRATRRRPPVAGLFDPPPPPAVPASMDILPSTEVADAAETRTASGGPGVAADAGLAYVQSLQVAADAEDNEKEAEERDVEEEILDIMEIDRELEELEAERESGKKHVFFEED